MVVDENRDEKSQSGTESITFRFEKDILRLLREEAVTKGTSLNALASQVISEHVYYGMNAPKAGLIPLSKNTIKMLLRDRTDEEIAVIARTSAKSVSDIIILLRSEFSVKAAIGVLESWLKTTGFHFTRSMQKDRVRFVIQHEMGIKWSIYLSEYMKYVMEQFGKPIKLKISESNISVEITMD